MTSIAHAARPYTRVLNHVPDDVILDVAGREFQMENGQRCVVGWVLRSMVGRILDKAAEKVDLERDQIMESMPEDDYSLAEIHSESETLAAFVGGKAKRWDEIFFGVTHSGDELWYANSGRPTLPVVEYAFARRVAEAAERRRGRR